MNTEPNQRPNRFSAFGAEREKLAGFIEQCPGRYAVEIGACRGATTAVLAEACRRAGKQLIAIDPWDDRQDEAGEEAYRAFLRAIEPYGRLVTVMREDSQDADLPEEAKGNLCLVFVDGDHTYPRCRMDMERYYRLLAPGGCLAVHDTFCVYWGREVQKGFTEFIHRLPLPLEIHHFQYEPTLAEAADHDHKTSGISYLFRKTEAGPTPTERL